MERSYGTMKSEEKTISHEYASDRYIELEKQHIELGNAIASTRNLQRQKKLRRQRKLIRAEQNLLYPYMVGTGYVTYTEKQLKLKGNQALYGRYVRGKKK